MVSTANRSTPDPFFCSRFPASPHAGRSYPTRVYFGDTHLHTANSGDAFLAGGLTVRALLKSVVKDDLVLEPGDEVRVYSAGGGGYGSPLERS